MEGEWKCSALVQKIRRVVLRSLYTPSSTLLSILISVSIFVSCHKKLLNRNDFTLRSDVINLQVYRFITYAFFHKDLNALLCNIFILWHFGSGLERSIGTVKHLYLTTMFTILSGLLYLLLNLVLFGPGKVEDVSGLTSVTFAMMGLSTARTRMRRSLFFGINIPTAFVPWVLLFAAFVIPGASFMVCIGGIIVGQAYGLGLCLFPELSEPKASALDKKLIFWLLKKLPGGTYIPGSLLERRAAQAQRRAHRKSVPVKE
ncbi:rhomboid domain-containing protein 2 isoform X2 [Latimeria chalumnae]|uniref:rhomboid domain-containing protein 2 isoform X2 n=1 Tax=Latimeria chalumnae TaxID=7897 RepID=UPI0003C13945|nr:PREDICTED: rhomboid domain-containing protein 2 isoform X3 [Latimeria chalumnae]|eukprot:XP_005988649.1 PREDICTED: rhomboid domain-containing protein 2 isoform X3 [Latimeria chalumnae]